MSETFDVIAGLETPIPSLRDVLFHTCRHLNHEPIFSSFRNTVQGRLEVDILESTSIPRPDLIGSRGHWLRLGMRGKSELVAALADLLMRIANTLHRLNGTEKTALCFLFAEVSAGAGHSGVGLRSACQDRLLPKTL